MKHPLGAVLSSVLDRFAKHRRRAQVIRRLLSIFNLTLLWLAVSCAFDRIFSMPIAVRSAGLLFVAIVDLSLTIILIVRLCRVVDRLRVASMIEASEPRLNGRLETLVTHATGRGGEASTQFLSRLEREMEAIFAETNVAKLVSRSSIRRHMTIAATLMAGLIGVTIARPLETQTLIARAFWPNTQRSTVAGATLHVSPGNASINVGQPLAILADVRGLGDAIPRLEYWQGEPSSTLASMVVKGDRFIYEFSSLNRPMSYRVRCGDLTSPIYRVNIRHAAGG